MAIWWTGLNIANKIKYIYYSVSFTKLQKSKEKSLNLKSYINRIFIPRRERKILGKSPKRRDKAQTKVDYTKLSLEIITQNYLSVYYVAKLVTYRDTAYLKIV